MGPFVQGQRWFNEAEPELGIGVIDKVEHKTITIIFNAAKTKRIFAQAAPSLKRVLHQIGEEVTLESGEKLTISQLQMVNHLAFYLCGERVVPEMELSSRQNIDQVQAKLKAGQFDDIQTYRLRQMTYQAVKAYQQFPHKGFLGSKVRLLPHQCYLVSTICERTKIRVLLADEVGLGKTVEAALILKSLFLKERIHKSLIIVPDSLVYQWYFELKNKFQIPVECMSLKDELEIEAQDLKQGPVYVISLARLIQDGELREKVLKTKWDLLIADEAHQIRWNFDTPSLEYQLVRELCTKILHIIFLSATPEMTGLESHFARLNLLDPQRFNDFERFKIEQANYKEHMPVIQKIVNNNYTEQDLKLYFSQLEMQQLNDRSKILSSLLDRHGTGRIYFRNTREGLKQNGISFPARICHAYPLQIELRERNDQSVFEAKMDALLQSIQKLAGQKILVIAHARTMIQKVMDELKLHGLHNIAAFHSDLTLVERDKAAADFAQEDGVQILLSTEIGSEGRNFEFAANLFLFDIPKVPEQLEQRIGRLDRIGQKTNINIHIPYVEETFEQILFDFYHKVLHSFETAPKGATSFYRNQLDLINQQLEKTFNVEQHLHFIQECIDRYKEHCQYLKEGHDVLLDLNSFDAEKAQQIMRAIEQFNQIHNLDEYINELCHILQIHHQDLNSSSYYIAPTENMLLPSFPGLPADGMSYTYQREVALRKNELQFMSWEHPLIESCFDLITNSKLGTTTLINAGMMQQKTFLIECFFKLEIAAHKASEICQYFPLTTFKVILDQNGVDVTDKYTKENYQDESIHMLANLPLQKAQKESIKNILHQKLAEMVSKAKQIANHSAQSYRDQAISNYNAYSNQEIIRLRNLIQVNSHIGPEEIEMWEKKQIGLTQKMNSAELTLDAIKIVI
jgi:ATP-dependent helicase HepA